MEETEKLFIGLLTKADLSAGDFEKREIARGAGLATMRAELDAEVEVPVLGEDGKPANDANGKPKMKKVLLRDSIREGMTFQVVDKKGKGKGHSFDKDGQENAVDTHDATAKDRGLSEKDVDRVNKAMEDALKLVEKLRTQKGPDGQPLFGEADMMEEVFTPLMREGLLPDNVIIDKYSATSQLLKATFGRYKQALKEAEEAKALKRDENAVAFGGADGKLGTLKALGGKAGQVKDRMQARMMKTMGKVGLDEDALRRIKLGGGIASTVRSFVTSNASDLEDLLPAALKNDMKAELVKFGLDQKTKEKALNADLLKHAPGLEKIGEIGEGKLDGLLGEDSNPSNDTPKPSEFKKLLAEVQTSRAMEVLDHYAALVKEKITDEAAQTQWIEGAGDQLSELASKIEFKLDDIPRFDQLETWAKGHTKEFTKMCEAALAGLGKVVKTGISGVVDIKGVSDSLKKTDHEREVKSAVQDAVQEIDAALAEAVTGVDAVAGVAISGQYVKRTKVAGAVDAATQDPVDGAGIVEALATGFEGTFAAAAPPPTDPPDGTEQIFAKVGSAIAAAFRAKADGSGLAKAMADSPAAAMGTVVQAARAAAGKELGTLGSKEAPSDGGAGPAFKQRVKDPSKQQAMLAKGALPDPDEAEEEMQQDEEQLRTYEDSLMLIDEAGFDAAQSRNIEVLISELQKNRKMLELAANLGQGLLSTGVKVLKPLADTGLGMHATDVLKLAKMIATLAVNIKKAADRWILWYKFRKTLERSKKAVSALTSTIQGFFNNKKEQIAFHTIDDAMQAVQIAFTIVGMVPEPITMGVGKTVNLVASGLQQANAIAGKVYNEAMLSKAWKTTVSAINNPGNRKLGLAALRLNPTLGMHAIAWAGAERQPPDPIARHLMDQLGVSAQTIAAGASGDQVKSYLTELLNEDRQIERNPGMDFDWLPAKYALTARDFFAITNRASKKATPKLVLAGEKSVLDVLKPLDNHDFTKLAALADEGNLDPAAFSKLRDEIEAAQQAMMNYNPRCEDGTSHEDMSAVQAEMLSYASAHANRLDALAAKSNLVRDQSIDELQAELDAIALLPDDATSQAVFDQMDDSNRVLKKLTGRSAFAEDALAKPVIKYLGDEIEKLRVRLA